MGQMLKAVIIEDEERSRIVLQNLLETYCPEIEVVGAAESVANGIKTVRSLQPEILFLDVQISGGTGFDVLEKLHDVPVAVIFTTAYDHYALKAFKFSALDYLLKPIDIEELKAAVKKAVANGRQCVATRRTVDAADSKTSDGCGAIRGWSVRYGRRLRNAAR